MATVEVIEKSFSPDTDELAKTVMLDKYPESRPEFDSFLAQFGSRLVPKVAYTEVKMRTSGDDSFALNGEKFSSPVLSRLTGNGDQVFPFIATCGRELESIDVNNLDFMASYWVDCLKEMALRHAVESLKSLLAEKYNVPFLSYLSPGSADASVWNIRDQQPLFRLFGNTESLLGVRLTPDCLMMPNKSLSGVAFSSKEPLSDCRFCTRADCNRRREACDYSIISHFCKG